MPTNPGGQNPQRTRRGFLFDATQLAAYSISGGLILPAADAKAVRGSVEFRRRVIRLTSGGAGAIHSYFDLCPESPDQSNVLAFQFHKNVPGAGRIMTVSRDGQEPRILPTKVYGRAHEGALQQWTHESHIAYAFSDRGRGETHIVDGSGRLLQKLPIRVRMFSPTANVALASTHELATTQARATEPAVYRIDVASGRVDELIAGNDVFLRNPLRGRLRHPELLRIKHTKWSPDGSRLFFVVHNEIRLRRKVRDYPIKSLYTCRENGSEVRYLGEFGHHPSWSPDGTGIVYFTREKGRHQFRRRNLNGGETILLSNMRGRHGILSPNGRRLVLDYGQRRGMPDTGIGVVTLATDAREHLITYPISTRYFRLVHEHATWDRTGQRIYFNSTHENKPGVYAIEL